MKLDYASPAARKRRWPARFFFGTLAALSVVLGTVLFMTYPGRNRARVTTYDMKCYSNLSQIGKGIMLYSNENRGQFPPDLATMAAAEELGLDTVICPSSPAYTGSGAVTPAMVTQLRNSSVISYTYLGAGRHVSEVQADEILAYHSGCQSKGINVLFGDGHVERLLGRDAEEIKQIILAGGSPLRRPASRQP